MPTPLARPIWAALTIFLAAGTLVTSEAAAASLSREPYLQSTDSTSTLLAFRTDEHCPSVVRFGPSGTEYTSEHAAGTSHLHTLSGLTPGAEYAYSVEACGQVVAAGKRFRTAPPVGTRKVHFAATGDSGKGTQAQREVANAILAARPEFSLALGDNAYESGTEAEHQNNLFEPMAEMLAEIPYFTTPGNHEYVTDKAAPYFSNFHLPTNNPAKSESYYSFDWGHVHFVSLDSMCARGTSSPGCTPEAQRQWLESDLAATTQPFKIVFFHHPPFSSGDHLSDEQMQRDWAPLLEKHGVDVVLAGHDHNYERSHPLKGGAPVAAGETGTHYVVVGSGGAALREWPVSQPSWSAVRNNTDYGYLDVKVEGGTLLARFVTPTGTEVDRFTVEKTLPELPAPTMHVTAEVGSGQAPLDALLVATATPTGGKVSWDFGDGTGGEGAQVAHTYAQPGRYTATATVTDPLSGATAMGTAEITVLGDDGQAPGEAPPLASEGGAPGGEIAPGEDTGGAGCGAAGGMILAPFGVIGLLRLASRRRR